jgi:pyruvate dehydrogenase E1 component
MFERFDEIFASCGWRTVELRFGKRLGAAVAQHPALETWLNDLPNADFAALSFQGGPAWRARITADLGKAGAAFLNAHDDDALGSLMTDLGGHCMASLIEAFDAAQDDVPTLFIAWTVKGFGLPFAGHKDNHSGLMNPTQMHAMRDAMGISEGDEWQPLAGVGANALPAVRAVLDRCRIPRAKRERSFGKIAIPESLLRQVPNRPPRPRSARSCST